MKQQCWDDGTNVNSSKRILFAFNFIFISISIQIHNIVHLLLFVKMEGCERDLAFVLFFHTLIMFIYHLIQHIDILYADTRDISIFILMCMLIVNRKSNLFKKMENM